MPPRTSQPSACKCIPRGLRIRFRADAANCQRAEFQAHRGARSAVSADSRLLCSSGSRLSCRVPGTGTFCRSREALSDNVKASKTRIPIPPGRSRRRKPRSAMLLVVVRPMPGCSAGSDSLLSACDDANCSVWGSGGTRGRSRCAACTPVSAILCARDGRHRPQLLDSQPRVGDAKDHLARRADRPVFGNYTRPAGDRSGYRQVRGHERKRGRCRSTGTRYGSQGGIRGAQSGPCHDAADELHRISETRTRRHSGGPPEPAFCAPCGGRDTGFAHITGNNAPGPSGDGCGRRGVLDFQRLGECVAQQAGAPINKIWSRETDLANHNYRHDGAGPEKSPPHAGCSSDRP